VQKTAIFKSSELPDRKPKYALVGEVDLVVVRFDADISVFYGRCLHRGALMSDGFVRGKDLICGVHYWDYRLDTGVSAYANDEKLPKFTSWVEGDDVCVDADEINAWTGHHGAVTSMGVPRGELPDWDDIQLITAQLHKPPLLDDEAVSTEVVIGPNARKPLTLKIPLFVSDMSFGALSETAKVALATGAEMSGTGICSGEGGMLPEEQAANSRYLYARHICDLSVAFPRVD